MSNHETHKHNNNQSTGSRSQHEGHDIDGDHEGMKHDEHKSDMDHKSHEGRKGAGHRDHHARMVADFRKRFWISLIFTIPILILSPMIQAFLGIRSGLKFLPS